MRRNEFKIGHELQNEAVTLCISDLLWWLPTSNGLHFLHHLQKKKGVVDHVLSMYLSLEELVCLWYAAWEDQSTALCHSW